MPDHPISRPVTTITPSPPWLNLRELWAYRETLFYLARLNINIKFKQTFIGLGWVVIQPLAYTALFVLLFSNIGHVKAAGVPYPILALAGLIPWGIFSLGLTVGGPSLINNQSLVKKVYMPRILIPLGVVAAGAVDLVIGIGVISAMLLAYQRPPSGNLVWMLPLMLVLAALAASSAAIWIAALSITYRDAISGLTFLTTILLFVTPIGYATSSVGPALRWVFAFNPMTAVVELSRGAFIPTFKLDWVLVGGSMASGIVIFVLGFYAFGLAQRNAADKI